MAHRSFTDTSGVQWEVWDVVPQWADRRSGNERRRMSVDDVADPPVLEQRRGGERRRASDAGTPRVKIGGGFVGGWLAFESAVEKRRLSPIPPEWDRASDAELSRWCARASAAPRRRPG
jgi:hypothetical protein